MLRIHEIQSAQAAKRYHRESLTKGDYYVDEDEIGAWQGLLAKDLGLVGETTKEDFDKLVDNIHPKTGHTLTQRQAENRRPGYDYTWSCPKGVSMAYSIGGHSEIKTAFQEAVKQTMGDLEKEVKTRVRLKGADYDRVSGNFAYAMFTHTTSREVDVKELVHAQNLGPDGLTNEQLDHLTEALKIDKNSFRETKEHILALPHLHAHCVVMNATRDSQENERIKALTIADIKQDAPFWQAVFHSNLARNLQDLGYGIEHGPRGFDIAGLNRECTQKFSLRTQEIERIASELGITNDVQKAEIGAHSRRKKPEKVNAAELKLRWRTMLNGAEQASMEELKTFGDIRPDISPKEALDQAIAHCFERESVTPYRKILAAALEKGAGSFTLKDLEQVPTPELIQKELGGQVLCTTHQVLTEERELLQLARTGKGQFKPLEPNHHKFFHDYLSSEQQAAVQFLLKSSDQVVSLAGAPGTGKTTLLSEIRFAIEKSGKQLFSYAPSSKAAEVMQTEGFNDANTVQYFLKNQSLHPKIKGQVVLIDEAGMLSISDLLGVLRIAKFQGVKVLLSGDVKQHSSPERGQALRLLEKTKVVSSYRVQQIMRQSDKYLEAVKAIDQGHFEAGLKTLDDLKWIKEIKGKDIYEQTAQAYLNGSKDKPPLLIAPTRAEGARLTTSVRTALMNNGRLNTQQKRMHQLVNLRWSEQQKREHTSYEVGQVMKFYQNVPGIYRGQRATVSEVSKDGIKMLDVTGKEHILPLDKANRFNVFEKRSLFLAKGDRLRFTDNGAAKKGQKLHNGKTYTVKGFKRNGDIELTNGWVIGHDFGHIEHGYVSTSHGSQGTTHNQTIALLNSNASPAINRAQMLVTLSRGRYKAQVFTDDKEGLIRWAKKSSLQLSATELVGDDIITKIQKGQVPSVANPVETGTPRTSRTLQQNNHRNMENIRRKTHEHSR